MSDKPNVLFVRVHNAGRSQMAAGFLAALSEGRVEVRSAESMPADQVNPVAVQASGPSTAVQGCSAGGRQVALNTVG